MSETHSPLADEPVTNSAPAEPDQDRKRAFTFCASSFGVVRLEDVHEIAHLKSDLVACYKPVNSQEMFALERMAVAQQLILRAARLDAGLFTSAINDVINIDNNPVVTMDPDMIGDIEITRQQNRNFCLAEGFRRIAKESDLMNLALRYRIQADRDYRRALEEFLRLERLRPKLPNEPDLLTHPDGKDDILAPHELNPWIPKPPVKSGAPGENDAPGKAPVSGAPTNAAPVPAATIPIADVSLRSFNRQERARPYIPEAGQPVAGPEAFTETLAAGAAPQFAGLLNFSSDAPAAHHGFALRNNTLVPVSGVESARPRARAPRLNNPSVHRRAGRLKNPEIAMVPLSPVEKDWRTLHPSTACSFAAL